jgi:uncharacterized membrane protein YbhN (UPF0104 family)
VEKSNRKRALAVVVPLVFFGLVAWLLQDDLRALDVGEITAALRSIAPRQIAAAAAFTVAGYAALVSFDLLARVYVGHRLGAKTTAAISLVCYVFNMNLGALVGAVGFRARLYSRHGLRAGDIAKITVFAVVGNWLGWTLVLGVSLASYPDALARLWHVPGALVRTIGAVLAVTPAVYPAVCALRRREVRFRDWRYELPAPRLACAQVAIGCAYWVWPAAVMWVLQPPSEWAPYPAVLSTSLVAAVAGVVLHVPGGIGVLEATFIELLGHEVAAGPLIAMLLGFRAVFLLAPLAAAAVLLLFVEWTAQGSRRASSRA